MSSFVLPRFAGGSATGWALADYTNPAAQSAPAAGGTAMLAFEQLPDNAMWLIDHAVISCTSTTPTTLKWYDTVPAVRYLIDYTGTGGLDVSEWPAGLQIHPGRSLVMVWEGCSDGAVGTVNLQARVLRRAS